MDMRPDTDTTPAPPREGAVLATRGLTKVYGEGETAVHALRGVDIDLMAGELIVLLGASGSGKSTLLNIVGGLNVPTEGRVFFRAEELTAFDESALTAYRRDAVGFVFQFYNLIAALTAEENVALVTEIARDPMPAAEALEIVGFGPRRHHFPAELSGGEQQRVAIAKRPEVLLCDEPTGALDSQTGIVVLEALERVNRETGATTVVITHNVGIADMAHRVISMADGRIVEVHRNETRVAPRDIHW